MTRRPSNGIQSLTPIPYYLICKAGGNNRGDTGPPAGTDYYRYNALGNLYNAGARPAFGTAASISSNSGFMTISTYGNAKNILTSALSSQSPAVIPNHPMSCSPAFPVLGLPVTAGSNPSW